ncbi:MAG: YibE/F family protein [Segniliparus sp.]|uniref:YibE/F family protein n=1 Tax=Segniliparus sp. TaxID=2804064 RepID=UPI003F30C642
MGRHAHGPAPRPDQPDTPAGHEHSHHGHGHSTGPVSLPRSRATSAVLAALAVAVLAVFATLALTWPQSRHHDIPLQYRTDQDQDGHGHAARTESASIRAVVLADCANPLVSGVLRDPPQVEFRPDGMCFDATAVLGSGPDAGRYVLLEIPTNRVTAGLAKDSGSQDTGVVRPGPGQPRLEAGDQIRVIAHTGPEGRSYNFDDFQRRAPMLLWAAVFAAVVVAVAGWRGLRALFGLAVAFAVLVLYTLPSLLNGASATLVAVVSAIAILALVLPIAHGANWRTASALLGTMVALGITALAGWLVIDSTRASGLSAEGNNDLQVYLGDVSMPGVLLAGFIIGSLGVLNDVTITQASAVFELADAGIPRRRVFGAAMRVGRDHIASTVYTLLFAYAGGALPLFLLLSVSGRPLGDLLTSDAVATEFARSAVGGIGLALSVPLTTAVAVALLPKKQARRPEPEPRAA